MLIYGKIYKILAVINLNQIINWEKFKGVFHWVTATFDELKNKRKYEYSNISDKDNITGMLYKQFVAWSCDSFSIGPITDYINHPILQELPMEEKYFCESDERIYIDLRYSGGYTNEIEKLSRNDSKLVLKI